MAEESGYLYEPFHFVQEVKRQNCLLHIKMEDRLIQEVLFLSILNRALLKGCRQRETYVPYRF